jgi:NAD(P)-dependent dehydrogenase (short-subunit alcohol dehydrogenase family)
MKHDPKTAVITGASSGIGAALVKAYREAGFRVIANSRSIRASDDPGILAIAGDIADPATAERIFREGVDRFGRIDTLVNNAGIFTAKPFTQFTADDWSANIATNLAGFFHVTQRAVQRMEAQGSGHIVQITTSIVDQPINGVPAVLASITKGGLNAACDRVRGARHSRQRGVARHHQDADAPAGEPCRAQQPAPGGPHGRDERHRRRGAVPRERDVRDGRDPARRWRAVRRSLVSRHAVHPHRSHP